LGDAQQLHGDRKRRQPPSPLPGLHHSRHGGTTLPAPAPRRRGDGNQQRNQGGDAVGQDPEGKQIIQPVALGRTAPRAAKRKHGGQCQDDHADRERDACLQGGIGDGGQDESRDERQQDHRERQGHGARLSSDARACAAASANAGTNGRTATTSAGRAAPADDAASATPSCMTSSPITRIAGWRWVAISSMAIRSRANGRADAASGRQSSTSKAPTATIHSLGAGAGAAPSDSEAGSRRIASGRAIAEATNRTAAAIGWWRAAIASATIAACPAARTVIVRNRAVPSRTNASTNAIPAAASARDVMPPRFPPAPGRPPADPA